jgi:hypothetical protein
LVAWSKILRAFAVLALFPLAPAFGAEAGPPRIIEFYRDFLKAGSDDAYRKIEQDAARICAEMKCPNPYLGIESLTGPKQAWWLNGFRSEEHLKLVGDAYAGNGPLTEALNQIPKRKANLIEEPSNVFANYREDLSQGPAWEMGRGRFLVITVTKAKRKFDGTVFEASDGTRFIVRAAQTRAEADAKAAVAGEDTNVFAVRPYWSMPAKEWMAADPEFWKTAPGANGK